MVSENQPSRWQKFLNSIEGKTTSRQLAAGVALGVLIGLVPKDSLLLIMFTVLTILSPANLLSAGCSAILFWYLGSLSSVENLMQWLGERAFQTDSLAQLLIRWSATPLFPWLRLDNSLVLGALLLGVALMLPVYLISVQFFDRYGDRFYAVLRNSVICRWFVGPGKTSLNEGQA
jgi:uncharacterized protein (TIGR03546 family)